MWEIRRKHGKNTSILAYAEVLVLFYDCEAAEYDIDAPRAVTNLLELVPIRPTPHEDAVLSSEQAYDAVGLDRRPLEPDETD